jgi:PilZ domain-containing protein
MPEKRRYSRKKRRFLIEVETPGRVSTGFTYDMSPNSIFIRSIRIPMPGSSVTARLSLPDGRRVALEGRVQRAYRAPGAMSRIVPSGFSLGLAAPPDAYALFLSSL